MGPSEVLIEAAVEARDREGQGRLLAALMERAGMPSALRVDHDAESGQIVLGATGEAHLGAEMDALRRATGLDIVVGAPRVAHRETLERRIEQTCFVGPSHDPTAHVAVLRFAFEPTPRGGGSAFIREMADGDATGPFDLGRAGIERGIAAVMGAGVLAGYPVVDVRATLVGAAFDGIGPSVAALDRATRAAFREALQRGGSILLEPVMAIEMAVRGRDAEIVADEVRRRRGWVRVRGGRAGEIPLEGEVPLAEMLGPARRLDVVAPAIAPRMRFARFAPVPALRGDEPPRAAAAALRRAG